MPIHRERRIGACPSDYFFDIVADVERYPEYLSFWQEAHIYRRESGIYHTRQKIGIGPARETFRTRTQLSRPKEIRVISDDKLFRHFEILWEFAPLPNDRCQVDFKFHIEAASFFMRRFMDVMLDEVSRSMVTAFKERALLQYANQQAERH